VGEEARERERESFNKGGGKEFSITGVQGVARAIIGPAVINTQFPRTNSDHTYGSWGRKGFIQSKSDEGGEEEH